MQETTERINSDIFTEEFNAEIETGIKADDLTKTAIETGQKYKLN